jgi:hypothetical protein
MPEGVPTAGLVLIVEVVAEALLLDAPRRRFSESCAAEAALVDQRDDLLRRDAEKL